MRQDMERKKLKPSRGTAEDAVVPVAVGIILRDNRVLVTRRLEGSHLAGSWEFPGGRIHSAETPEEALRREIAEELGVRIDRATLIHRQSHTYPEREVELHFFLCTGVDGEPSGVEGQDARWVSAGDLDHLPTPAANAEVIRMLKDQIG
jgi:8-oxo-dGTP diphosphatase